MSEKTLPERMREAAEVLDDVAARARQLGGSRVARRLRSAADTWEAEDSKPAHQVYVNYNENNGDIAVYVRKPDGHFVAVYVDPRLRDGYDIIHDLAFSTGDLVWKP